jgi:hypothetical protein
MNKALAEIENDKNLDIETNTITEEIEINTQNPIQPLKETTNDL